MPSASDVSRMKRVDVAKERASASARRISKVVTPDLLAKRRAMVQKSLATR